MNEYLVENIYSLRSLEDLARMHGLVRLFVNRRVNFASSTKDSKRHILGWHLKNSNRKDAILKQNAARLHQRGFKKIYKLKRCNFGAECSYIVPELEFSYMLSIWLNSFLSFFAILCYVMSASF